MRYLLKLIGILLAAILLINLAFCKPVKAAESYTVKISLGSNKQAHFSDSSSKIKKFVKPAGETKVSELVDGIQISPEEDGSIKYAVKGLRLSGDDYVYDLDSSIKVTRDETYVVAYGIADIKKYVVKYVDEKGNLLDASKLGTGVSNPEDFYGTKGEEITIPARHVQGLTPDAESKTVKIGDNTEISFTYAEAPAKGETTIVEKTTVVEKSSTVVVNEDPTIVYVDELGEGTDTIDITGNGNPQVVSNRNETTTTTGGTTTNRRANGANGANGNTVDAEAEFGTGEGEGEVVVESKGAVEIEDEDVPLAGENGEETTIPDEEVPTAAEVQTSQLAANLLITILIIAVAVVVTVVLVNQKKNATIIGGNKKDNNNK